MLDTSDNCLTFIVAQANHITLSELFYTVTGFNLKFIVASLFRTKGNVAQRVALNRSKTRVDALLFVNTDPPALAKRLSVDDFAKLSTLCLGLASVSVSTGYSAPEKPACSFVHSSNEAQCPLCPSCNGGQNYRLNTDPDTAWKSVQSIRLLLSLN